LYGNGRGTGRRELKQHGVDIDRRVVRLGNVRSRNAALEGREYTNANASRWPLEVVWVQVQLGFSARASVSVRSDEM